MIFESKNTKILQSLLEVELETKYVDLHNDYSFYRIIADKLSYTIEFKKYSGQGIVSIIFKAYILDKFEGILKLGSTLDNFHRGRYLINSELHDVYEGRICMYLEFLPDISIEIRCLSFQILTSE